MPITINLDVLIDAILDTRTPHYWDPKRRKIIRGSSDLDDEKARRVLIDTIGKRRFRQLVDALIDYLDDDKDVKAVQDAAKGTFDKFNRMLIRRPDIRQAWIAVNAEDLIEAAQDWLVLQGIEEFIATGEMADFVLGEEEEDEEEDIDDDDEEEEEPEEADDDEEEDELEEELDEEDEELDEEIDEEFDDDDEGEEERGDDEE